MAQLLLLSGPSPAGKFLHEGGHLSQSSPPLPSGVIPPLCLKSPQEYYFKSSAETSASDGQFLKYRNPKYLSMLNHLRFYLPEVFPALDKILFVDDDIVVQEDLSPLWKVRDSGVQMGHCLLSRGKCGFLTCSPPLAEG